MKPHASGRGAPDPDPEAREVMQVVTHSDGQQILIAEGAGESREQRLAEEVGARHY